MGYRSKVRKDLTGHKYHLLTVIEQANNIGMCDSAPLGKSSWKCRCRCGTEIIVRGNNLRTGNTKSCGCEDRRITAERNTTHGLGGHWLYDTWKHLNDRCLNPACKSFRNYGARKIGICDEWRNDDVGCAEPYQTGDRSGLANFIDWVENNLGECPEGFTLDRIDNDRGYCPGNLRWADRTTQRVNQRPHKSKREATQKLIFGY